MYVQLGGLIMPTIKFQEIASICAEFFLMQVKTRIELLVSVRCKSIA